MSFVPTSVFQEFSASLLQGILKQGMRFDHNQKPKTVNRSSCSAPERASAIFEQRRRVSVS